MIAKTVLNDTCHTINDHFPAEGTEHTDELEADGVPPYEDRLGPDG